LCFYGGKQIQILLKTQVRFLKMDSHKAATAPHGYGATHPPAGPGHGSHGFYNGAQRSHGSTGAHGPMGLGGFSPPNNSNLLGCPSCARIMQFFCCFISYELGHKSCCHLVWHDRRVHFRFFLKKTTFCSINRHPKEYILVDTTFDYRFHFGLQEMCYVSSQNTPFGQRLIESKKSLWGSNLIGSPTGPPRSAAV